MDPDRPLILIVEDEVLLRISIAEDFETAGWSVVQTATAEEAIALLSRLTPSAVFTDIQLGGDMTGWDVGDACCLARVPVVFTSGAIPAKGRLEAEGRFYKKPYDAAALVAAFARWRP